MAKCAKCDTELGFAAKFCAVCGTAREFPESDGFAPPTSQVNPFAATASPTSKNPIAPVPDSVVISGLASLPSVDAPATRESGAPSQSRPPSRPPGSTDSSPVSPLAVSGALSQRGAFQQAVASVKAPSIAPPPTPERPAAKKPGTQMMPNAPNRPMSPATGEPSMSARPPSQTPQPPAKAAARTVAMDASSLLRPPIVQPQPSPAPAPPAIASAQPVSAQSPSPATGSPFSSNVAQPPAQQPPANAQHSAYGQPPANAQQPAGWAWGTPNPAQPQPPAAQPPAQAGPYGYSVGYFPGSRVHVTWSNGQRYPATVSQVTGSQCLVVFPDGQQHWVEMMYLTPG